jgi:hypothetical protein
MGGKVLEVQWEVHRGDAESAEGERREDQHEGTKDAKSHEANQKSETRMKLEVRKPKKRTFRVLLFPLWIFFWFLVSSFRAYYFFLVLRHFVSSW